MDQEEGTESETYKGDVTTYRVDGLKKSQAQFKKTIDQYIDEEVFKQLTNVYYIAESMKKDDRRKMLFDLVGDLSDEEVINKSIALKPLIAILDGRSVDDKRQALQEERVRANDDIKTLSTRIDEADQNLPDLTGMNKDELTEKKMELENLILASEKEIAMIKNGGFVSKKRTEINELRSSFQTMRNEYKAAQLEKTSELQEQKQAITNLVYEVNGELDSLNRLLQKESDSLLQKELSIEHNTAEMEWLRADYKAIYAETMQPFDEHKLACAFCGQDYQEDKKEEIRNKYEKETAAFNVKKAERLEGINASGKALADKNTLLQAEIEETATKIAEIKSKQQEAEASRSKLVTEQEKIEVKIVAIKGKETTFEDTEAYKAILSKVEAIQAQIEDNEAQSTEEASTVSNCLDEAKTALNEIHEKLYAFEYISKQEQRKQNLIEEQKQRAARVGEIEKQLFLLDEFIRTKVSLLTEKINSQFQIVTFKLFEIQKNGGLKELCEPLYDGREFNGALSNGEKINVGVDIINTVSRLKGINVPMFIDNSESVTKWLVGPAAQMIQLRAEVGQKELRVITKIKEEVA